MGYGGLTMKLQLETGETDVVKGPWHSSSDSLFHHTGVDVRNTYYISYVIATHYIPEKSNLSICCFNGILEKEIEGVESSFNLPEERALFWVEKLGRPIHYAYRSYGGGSRGRKLPDLSLLWEGQTLEFSQYEQISIRKEPGKQHLLQLHVGTKKYLFEKDSLVVFIDQALERGDWVAESLSRELCFCT